MKNIIIFGPQGSGKGTQADILSDKFSIPHVSTGRIFREEIKKGTELGKKADELINAGNLLPDDITNEIVKNRLLEKDCKNGYILDGYPRDIAQAEYFDTIAKISHALEIWIPDKISVERINKRRTCQKCGEVFHLEFNPPKKTNTCDECGGELTTRKDDKKEWIKKRLEIYHSRTENLIDYYKNKNIYHKIDGRPGIDEVAKNILEIIK